MRNRSFIILAILMLSLGLSSGQAKTSPTCSPAAAVFASLPAASGQTRREERPSTQPGQTREVVRLQADLVNVVVTASTSGGKLLKDLEADDFEIFEDGVPQKIKFFRHHSDLPLNMVMIYDASLSIRSRIKFEKAALSRFLHKIVRPIDNVAILTVSTDVVMRQNFTANIDRLLSAIDNLNASGATALYDAIVAATEPLGTMPGRRIIVVFSDGRDTISRNSLASTLKRAQQVDGVIFSVYTFARPASANIRDLTGERRLESLSNNTGGEVFYPNTIRDLDPILTRLAEQLRTQYIIGFTSSNETRDGSFRRLKVRVKRAHVYARTRAGYYAPPQ